jgi:hypothetical protein
MLKINYLAVVVAAVSAFLVGAVWYSPLLFGKAYTELRGVNPGAVKAPAVVMIGELARLLVIGFVLARLVALVGVSHWKSAASLGLWLWLGFFAMILLGAVQHEGLPWKLFAIHVGDGLVKIPLMAVILAAWRS